MLGGKWAGDVVMFVCDYCKGVASGLSCVHCGAPRRQLEGEACIEVTTCGDARPVYLRGWLTLNEVRALEGLAPIREIESAMSADRQGIGGLEVGGIDGPDNRFGVRKLPASFHKFQ